MDHITENGRRLDRDIQYERVKTKYSASGIRCCRAENQVFLLEYISVRVCGVGWDEGVMSIPQRTRLGTGWGDSSVLVVSSNVRQGSLSG